MKRTRNNPRSSPCLSRARCPGPLGHRALVLALALALAGVGSSPARAQDDDPAHQLSRAIAQLVPYDLDGTTPRALRTLDELASSPVQRIASTARFIRAAAEVDLLAFAMLSDDAELRAGLAAALRTTPEQLLSVVQAHVEQASSGSHAQQIAPSAQLLGCLDEATGTRCGPILRQVADSGGASATAARLYLLRSLIQAVEGARAGTPNRTISVLLEQSGPICAGPCRPEIARLCREVRGGGSARVRLAEAVYRQAVEDVLALERAGRGDDPLVGLASGWVSTLRGRLGWLAFTQPFGAELVDGLTLPEATSPATPPPLELLIVGPEEVSLALSPTTMVRAGGNRRLGREGGFALPGKTLLRGPFHYRPVVRPIKGVTEPLGQLRGQVNAAIEAMGTGGPAWLAPDQRPLGLVVDRRTTLVDLSRYIKSARSAGYQRFMLLGRRQDGGLAALPATLDNTADGLGPGERPRLRIAPAAVEVTGSGGRTASFSHHDRGSLGGAVARLLDGSEPAFVVQGRPMMPFGLVFPTIDAVVTAAQPNDPECLVLLPQ